MRQNVFSLGLFAVVQISEGTTTKIFLLRKKNSDALSFRIFFQDFKVCFYHLIICVSGGLLQVSSCYKGVQGSGVC